MGGEEERGTAPGVGTRPVVYCVIPSGLASKLHDVLRQHFADDPGVEVVVERRGRERRSGAERRRGDGETPAAGERRQIRAAAGRRVGERRAAPVPVSPPPLPRRARRHADQIAFVERHEPSTEDAEDQDTARLVAKVQAGDKEVFATIYTRYFSRVYGYMRMALGDPHEAEDATQQVFVQVLESIAGYERRRQPFRAWLFTAARNYAISHVRKHSRVEPTDRDEIEQHPERAAAAEAETPVFDWLTDRDLHIFVERLPDVQRQVLVMRYVLDLANPQIARALGRSPDEIKVIHYRALKFLRDRMAAIGREPRDRGRAKVSRRFKQAEVLRHRRFALLK